MMDGYRGLLAHRDFRLLWLGQVTSQFGDACYEIAMVWLVLQLTGQDYFSVGLVIFARLAPYVVIGPFAGVYVDRWDRKRTMVITDVVRGFVVLIVPLLHVVGALEVWHVAAVAFTLTTCRTLFNPALQASIPRIVDESRLVGANALIQASGQTAAIAGPAAAGLLLTWISADALFVLDGLTFLFSAAMIALLALHALPRDRSTEGTVRTELAGTIRTLSRKRPVLWSVVLYAVGLLTIAGSYRVGLAALSENVLGGGSATYGLLIAALAGGTVLGALVLGATQPRRPTVVIFGGWALWGVCFAVLGLGGSLVLALVLAVVSGIGESAATVFTTALVQRAIPPEQLGKVFGLWSLLCSTGESLSGVLTGYGLGRLDVRTVLGIAGAATLVMSLFGLAVTARQDTGVPTETPSGGQG